MTPIFLNSSSNTYWPTDLHHQDHDHFSNNNQEILSPNNSQASSSSNSLITHMFLNSTVHDENGISDRELQPPQHQQHEDYNFGSQVYKDDRIENKDDKGHEFPTWNKSTEMNNMINNDQNQVKWMSSKMRVMLKMKKSDPVNPNAYRSTTREVMMLEDHKLPNSPNDQETDNSSNSTTSNSSVPIRVCSDCNTTKTPLWRSGPRGPKSLCNACGIRQRKARRALAIAAAENGNCNVSIDHQSMIMVPLKVTKTPHKHHKKPSNNNGHFITKYKKKRQYTKQIITIPTPSSSPSPSSSSPSPPSPLPLPSPPSSSSPVIRKNCVEEFLESLSKNLTFYRVFPQDEKEAAILLMALSCGYAHEM